MFINKSLVIMNATVRYAQSTCILLSLFIDDAAMNCFVRYLLSNPEVCGGRKVLDLGCGCGASAIAARLSGASHVVANDIDPSKICVSAPHTKKKKKRRSIHFVICGIQPDLEHL